MAEDFTVSIYFIKQADKHYIGTADLFDLVHLI